MPDHLLPVLNDFLVLGAGAIAWLSGEAGRIVVASGAGGLVRWLASERKRIREGILSVFTGILVGSYLWPLVLAAIGLLPGVSPESGDSQAMAGFIAGMMGISGAKIVIAVIEARGRQHTSGGGDGQDRGA
ncbi:hypothetical protein SAMN05421774_10852 [Gemmobacter megaterium]|uniref:Uncharacterized protein n=1 Tax=Gemmobacter megaterium TaxID=1086013 RepID=A0A1N7QAL2_9RHOB|nr:hypothetical protein [Gemmobacter megaterium]GGE24381.1 hypothetical protein GCM10011345_32930 [Gemmobacter megaterium]SIT19920.1 hypothetical protein SAMN05421774_10852 [Gemmobacter megaterium]